METFTHPDVDAVFLSYPEPVRNALYRLRNLILQTAHETPEVLSIEETLKWGEPAYLCKTGSTIRLGWKEKHPDQYALYFHCKTKLIDTFKELYGDRLSFEANRAILFKLDENLPEYEVKQCIALSLTYHRIKHLPMLGA